MPNWTSNRLRAEGSPQQVSEFLEKIKGENGILDFNSIIPMPELLKHTASGATTIDGQKLREWYVVEAADRKNKIPAIERLFTADEEAELARIGHRSWYSWCNVNWGTKWNACEAKIEMGESRIGFVYITYRTAWNAPKPIFKKLVEMFPLLNFAFEWRNEDDPEYPHRIDAEAKTGGDA